MTRMKSVCVCKASAVQTRCLIGKVGNTACATGISLVFSSTRTWKTRFLAAMGHEGQQMGSGLLARSGSPHGLAIQCERLVDRGCRGGLYPASQHALKGAGIELRQQPAIQRADFRSERVADQTRDAAQGDDRGTTGPRPPSHRSCTTARQLNRPIRKADHNVSHVPCADQGLLRTARQDYARRLRLAKPRLALFTHVNTSERSLHTTILCFLLTPMCTASQEDKKTAHFFAFESGVRSPNRAR